MYVYRYLNIYVYINMHIYLHTYIHDTRIHAYIRCGRCKSSSIACKKNGGRSWRIREEADGKAKDVSEGAGAGEAFVSAESATSY